MCPPASAAITTTAPGTLTAELMIRGLEHVRLDLHVRRGSRCPPPSTAGQPLNSRTSSVMTMDAVKVPTSGIEGADQGDEREQRGVPDVDAEDRQHELQHQEREDAVDDAEGPWPIT